MNVSELVQNDIVYGMEALNVDFDHPDSPTEKVNVPFFKRLKQPLTQNSGLTIDLYLPSYANGFRVDLVSSMSRDILFHLNPRLDMNCVVRNSFLSRVWGIEEKKSFRKSPFKKGKDHYLEIYLREFDFLVAVNGAHYCAFSHRAPFHSINVVEINGDLILKKIELFQSDHYPFDMSRCFVPSEINNPEVPFLCRIPQIPIYKLKLVLTGIVKLLPDTFIVNLQAGTTFCPHPRIPLHISVRWRPTDIDKVVFNSWTNGKWGEEVTFPMNDLFSPGRSFSITVSVTSSGFHVFVGEKPFPTFRHRLNPEQIEALYVEGDVKILDVDQSIL